MALNGAYIACGFVGGTGRNGETVTGLQAPLWSVNLPTAGTTTQVAPNGSYQDGEPIIFVNTSVDAFVAVGPNPDAVNGPRLYCKKEGDMVTNSGLLIFVKPGDKVAWAPA